MKRTLYLKFTGIYCLFGLLGFLVISILGSRLIEEQILEKSSSDLYREATTIASDSDIRYSSVSNRDNNYNNLKAIASYEHSEIWLMNGAGEIVIDTSKSGPLDDPKSVSGFNPAKWGSSYYRTGNFFGYFDTDMMSVIAPITSNMNVKGYVAIHYPLSYVYEHRENILREVYIVFLIIFLLSLMILVLFNYQIYRPLKKIITGTNEFSAGHLDYNIPIHTHDEMGYLAASLNYMSDEMDKTGTYQRSFISNVSHDFRSPLTSIKGYVEAMCDGTIPPEMHEKYLGIILFEANRLEKLTRSLLTLNKLDVKTRMMNIETFDINSMMKHVAETFEGTCREKKISIELLLSGESLYAKADQEQIQQVVYNLLDNAIKFSPNASTITMETTEQYEKIFVSVKDRGVGISKENLSKIWDRFYKIDSSRGKDRRGSGLGLSIVKEIVNAHGQNINVVSTEGVGTEFIFSLEKGDR